MAARKAKTKARARTKARATTKATAKSSNGNLETLVRNTLGRVSYGLVAYSAIHVDVTDGEEQSFHVGSGGAGVEVRAGAPTSAVGVRIRGTGARIRALLDGRKHPSAVFVEGGIEVFGDARQITALSEELPALTGAPKLRR